jgi:uncharacterized membrane protein
MVDDSIFDEHRARPSIALPLHLELNGRFAIGRLLGRPGGFGITYLALDTRLHRAVAIKEYYPRDLATRGGDGMTMVPQTEEEGEELHFGRDRFLHEARTLARFDHPGIVGVQDFFEANGTAYLVMPYYDGQTLEAYLRAQSGGRLDAATAVALMLPTLDALHLVHEAGLLHRDLKPENIYLRAPSGQPTLLDFGSARAEAALRSRTLERACTPGYAAVEQYITEGEQGPWTDVYACGATLYRLLTGKTPPEALARLGATDPLTPVSVHAPEVTSELADVVRWALHPQAGSRPQRARELQAALREVAGSGDDVGLTLPVDMTPAAQPGHSADESGVTRPVEPVGPAPGADDARGSLPTRDRHGKRAKIAAVLVALTMLGAAAVLAPRMTVEGTVQDSRGEPLPGVKVELGGDYTPPRLAETDATGRFRFRLVPADGRYVLSAAAPGYIITHNDDVSYTGSISRGTVMVLKARTLEEAYREFAAQGTSTVMAAVETHNQDVAITARPLLDRAVQVFPDSTLPRLGRTVLYWFLGEYQECLEDIARLPAGAAGDMEEWCNIGAGNLDRAAAVFRERALKRGASADNYIGLSVIAYRQGDAATAVHHYSTAVRLQPEFAGGRERVQSSTSYRYNPAEWATIEVIHADYTEAARVAAAAARGRGGFPFRVRNDCRHPVRVAVRYLELNGTWMVGGWWSLTPGAEVVLTYARQPRPETRHNIWYYYAETTNNTNIQWRGDHGFTFRNEPIQMRRMDNTRSVKSWTLQCNMS